MRTVYGSGCRVSTPTELAASPTRGGEQLVREEAAAGREADAGLRPSTARGARRRAPTRDAARAARLGRRRAACPVSSRSPRIVASTCGPRPIDRLEAAGRQRRLRPVGGRERGQVAVEPRRVPAPARPVERVRPGPDRLVRAVAPSRRGCGGSRAPAGPSSRSRSRGSRPRRGARPRWSYCAAARSSSCSPIALRRASGARPAAWAGGRRPARSAPPRPGRRGSARRPRRGPAPSASAASSVAAHVVLALPRHVVQQVERHRPDARRREPRRPRPRRPAAGAAGPAAAAARRRTTARRARPASRPRRRSAARVAALVGPRVRLDRHLRARGQAEARRGRGRGWPSIDDGAAAASACRRRDTRVSSGWTARPERGVGRIRPQVDLRQQRADERLDAGPRSARRGPRVHDEVAVRAQRDAERDVDVERDRRPRRAPAASTAAAATSRTPAGSSTRQPSGVRLPPLDLLALGALGLRHGRRGRS